MAPLIQSLVLALAATAVANPLARSQEKRCNGQSCLLADTAGSTGQKPDHKAKGGNASGNRCITQYTGLDFNSVPARSVRSARSIAEEEEKRTASYDMLYSFMNSKRSLQIAADLEERGELASDAIGACKTYTLVFGKGTFETGTMGITVGPALKSGLNRRMPGQWNIQGVDYDATYLGDQCVGLPGGMIAAKLINSIHQSCPDTKIVASGYSQGAMVAHNGIAYASDEARAQVVALVTFGDPFDGASVKGWNGLYKVYCAATDKVCTGAFTVGVAHLSYAEVDTGNAVSWIASNVPGTQIASTSSSSGSSGMSGMDGMDSMESSGSGSSSN